jgi:cell division protein FtsI (penicillin-binding protein 3)
MRGGPGASRPRAGAGRVPGPRRAAPRRAAPGRAAHGEAAQGRAAQLRAGQGRPGPRPAGGPAQRPIAPGRRRQAPAALRRPILRRGRAGRRLNLTLLCLILVLALFAARLIQLQGLDAARYRTLADEDKVATVPLPTVRGSITTSDGTVLAMTVQTDLVFGDPAEIPRGQQPAAAAKLAGPLRLAPGVILSLLQHPSSPEYVVLSKVVSASTAAAIASLKLPGIGLIPSYARSYPNGDLAASVLGFTDVRGGDLVGEGGLEQEFNAELAGRDGSEEVEKDAGGQPIPGTQDNVRPPIPAVSIRTTIQSDIQYEAEQECKLRVKQTHARNCSIIVMDPRTGQILAMAQWPTFSPASPTSLQATQNIAIGDVFAPGSTLKPVTVAAALEQGHQTAMSPYTIPYQIDLNGYSFHDAEEHATARYTIAGIVAYSSNVGMVQVAQHISPQVQNQYLRAFGLGSDSGLGLPGETPGLLPAPGSADYWGDERYELSFGQGVGVTALQMASIYSTIANGGVRVQPSLVAGAATAAGVFRPAPVPPRRRVIQARTAATLMKILQQVPAVDAAQGEPWGLISGYTVAAKTGTAQVPGSGNCLCQYGSSYIGIAPANNPQLVVAVNIQDPKDGYYGDVVAGPVFYNVMKFALQTMKIPPDGGHAPYIRLTAP